jgi:hypothetical protein
MGRWDIDDSARSPDRAPAKSIERRETTRRDPTTTVERLSERVSPRAREEIGNGHVHGLTLPEGRDREEVRDQGRITCAVLKWSYSSARRSTA